MPIVRVGEYSVYVSEKPLKETKGEKMKSEKHKLAIAYAISDGLVCETCFRRLCEIAEFPLSVMNDAAKILVKGSAICRQCGRPYLRE